VAAMMVLDNGQYVLEGQFSKSLAVTVNPYLASGEFGGVSGFKPPKSNSLRPLKPRWLCVS
jgi:hypothetical protein